MKNAIVTYARGRADYGLTVREQKVLALASKGLTGPQIAREHEVGPSTVHTQMKKIYRKLGVHTRASAVAKALNENLFDCTPSGAGRPDSLLTPNRGAARSGNWRHSASPNRGLSGGSSVTCPHCGSGLDLIKMDGTFGADISIRATS